MLNGKKVLLALFFLYVLPALVLPPIFTDSQPQANNSSEFLYELPDFNATTILFFAVWCIVFYIVCAQYNLPKPQTNFKSCLHKSFAAFLAILAIWALFSIFCNSNFKGVPNNANAQWFVSFFGVFCAAAFEESLYRFYLPQSMQFFIQNAKIQSPNAGFAHFAQIATEILTILLFALAHRYLGIMAVINAAFAGAVLRWLAKKTNIVCCWLVHSIYNCIIFALFVW